VDGNVRCSFYSDYFEGRETASGRIFHQKDLVCASPVLPLESVVTLENGDTRLRVWVIDRGPYATDDQGRAIFPLRPHPTRHLDLSSMAFSMLFNGDMDRGTGEAQIVNIEFPNEN
jgi:rare lipoprotein A (peptidoglycan hydrolase)